MSSTGSVRVVGLRFVHRPTERHAAGRVWALPARGIERSMPPGSTTQAPRYREVADTLGSRSTPARCPGRPRAQRAGIAERVRPVADDRPPGRRAARPPRARLPGPGRAHTSPRPASNTRCSGCSDSPSRCGRRASSRPAGCSRSRLAAATTRRRRGAGTATRRPCWLVRRVRFGDDEPLLVEAFHVPERGLPRPGPPRPGARLALRHDAHQLRGRPRPRPRDDRADRVRA